MIGRDNWCRSFFLLVGSLLAAGQSSVLLGVTAASNNHALSIQAGRVCAAGQNDNGQLGDGTFIERRRPVFSASASNIVGVSTNERHTLAVTGDGQLWAWGNNTYGRLGDGSTYTKATPVQVQLTGVVAVAAGQYHSLALKSDGTVWGWGYNGNGQVGDGTTATRTEPVIVVGLSDVVAIAAGSEFSLALRRDGTVWSWGQNNSGQLGDESNIRRTAPVQTAGLANAKLIAAGSFHALAVTTDGAVWSWGAGGYGQLGNGATRDQSKPVRVGTLSNVASIAASTYFSLAARTDGTVWAWGRNDSGQLGDRTTTLRNAPVQARDVTRAVAVAAGGDFSVAETSTGSRLMWGGNAHGQFGTGNANSSNGPVTSPACVAAEAIAPILTSFTTKIAGSGAHLLSVQSEQVCAAGENDYSQLGDGTVIDRWRPASSAALSGVVSIATGARHSLAVTGDGSVWAWGNNLYGRLGDETGIPRARPVRLRTVTNAVAVAAGEYHSLALLGDGTVLAWGYNGNGQVGDGSNATRSVPTRVVGLTDIVAIAAGSEFSLALKRDGTVWSWGQNNTGQLGDRTYTRRSSPVQVEGLSEVVAIAAGNDHSVAIKGTDGSVWTWGYGAYGQLGSGSTQEQPSVVRAGDLAGIVGVAAGTNFTLAVRADGSVWAWGANTSGQLGDRTTLNRTAPVQVSAMANATLVAAGASFSVVEKSDGSAWIWGDNSRGQFGNGTTSGSTVPVALARCQAETPNSVSSTFRSKVLAAAIDHSLVVRADGSIWVSGANRTGQLGTGTLISAAAGRVTGLAGVKTVSTNESHSLAVTNDGAIWAWGSNSYGGLGDGTTAAKLTPVRVIGFTGAVAVAAGRYHSLALKSDGTVWAFGYNGNGQLGDGTTTNRSSPVQVISLSGVISIAAGDEHSLALKSDGTVWAWGLNSSGQLGNGTSTRSTFPVQVSDLTGVLSIAAGAGHSLAIRQADGSVWTWGYGGYGQLGDGGTTERYHIVRAGSLTGAVAVAGGANFSLAVLADGSVWSWGLNRAGQLGDRSTDGRLIPVRTDGLASAVDVAGGASHALALLADGRLYAWGANDAGQFGQAGRPPASTVPVEVDGGFVACNCVGGAGGGGAEPPPVALEPARLSGVRPNSAVAGSAELAIVISGEGLAPESVVQWNQTAVPTTFLSSRELRATIGRQLLTTAGTAAITVLTGGARSNAASFLITSPEQPKPVSNVSATIEPKQLSYPAPASDVINGAQDDLFWIANKGETSFKYLVEVQNGSAWLSLASGNLSLAKVEGTVAPRSEVKVTVRTSFNRLTRPVEDGTIRVAYGPELEFGTTITVRAGSLNKPEILLSRSRIQVFASLADFNSGNTLAVPFHILNLGTAALQWEAVSTVPWLTGNPKAAPNAAGLAPVGGSSGDLPTQQVALLVDLGAMRRTELNGSSTAPTRPIRGSIVVKDLTRPDVLPQRIEVDVYYAATKDEGFEASVYPTGFLFTGDVGQPLEPQSLTVESTTGRDVEFDLSATPLWKTLFGDFCASPPCVTALSPRNSARFAIRPLNLPSNHPEVVTPTVAATNIRFNVKGSTTIPAERGGDWRIEALVVRRGVQRSAGSAANNIPEAGGLAADRCEDTLHILSTSLPEGFFVTRTALQPVELKIVNGCGTFLSKGTVLAIPSNGDPPFRLRPVGAGTWVGGWQPARSTGGRPVRLDLLVTGPGGIEKRRSIEGAIIAESTPASAAPTTPSVLNAASFSDANVVTPGSIVTLFGTDFLDREGSFQAGSGAAPTSLGGASVLLGDLRLPLLSAARTAPASAGATPVDQINAVVPFELPAGQQLLISVERNGLRSNPVEVIPAGARPGIFVYGGQYAVALDQSYQLVTTSNRAERGKYVQIYATGMGRVASPPQTGRPAPAEPLSNVTGRVRVLFNGTGETPAFAGLAPGFLGLYQVNVAIPETVRPVNGLAEVVIEVDGIRSNAVTLPVL